MTVKPPPSPIINTSAPTIRNHVKHYVLSNGLNGETYGNLKFCLLTTQGRVSGNWIRTALLYNKHEKYIYVIASDGGNIENPDWGYPNWYKNILVNPEVWVQVGTETYWGKCSILDINAEPDLRQYLWSKACKMYPDFIEYQSKRPGDLFPIILIERA